jgi:hypothetical protein
MHTSAKKSKKGKKEIRTEMQKDNASDQRRQLTLDGKRKR